MAKEINIKALNAYASMRSTLDYSGLNLDEQINLLIDLITNVKNNQLLEGDK